MCHFDRFIINKLALLVKLKASVQKIYDLGKQTKPNSSKEITEDEAIMQMIISEDDVTKI